MKQIKFVGAALAAVLMLLTSCLGETKNTGELYHVPGVVRYAEGKLLIDTRQGTLYSTQISPAEYYEGDWMYVSFAYDMDSPENANADTNGYIHVTLLENPNTISTVTPYGAPDTTQLMHNEIPLLNAAVNVGYYQYFDYMNGYLLLTSAFKEQTDIRYTFEMFYDYDQKLETYEGRNTYVFYVRAFKRDEGKSPTVEYVVPNAYRIESIIKNINAQEKSAGNESFYVSFRYVDEIKAETGEFTWKTDGPIEFKVPEEEEK